MNFLSTKMAMAKIILLILFAITFAEATEIPAEWASARKSVSNMETKLKEAMEGVKAAAPPEKKVQVHAAAAEQQQYVTSMLGKAQETEDEKKFVDTCHSFELASKKVIEAPPAEKFNVMVETFKAVAVPK